MYMCIYSIYIFFPLYFSLTFSHLNSCEPPAPAPPAPLSSCFPLKELQRSRSTLKMHPGVSSAEAAEFPSQRLKPAASQHALWSRPTLTGLNIILRKTKTKTDNQNVKRQKKKKNNLPAERRFLPSPADTLYYTSVASLLPRGPNTGLMKLAPDLCHIKMYDGASTGVFSSRRLDMELIQIQLAV